MTFQQASLKICSEEWLVKMDIFNEAKGISHVIPLKQKQIYIYIRLNTLAVDIIKSALSSLCQRNDSELFFVPHAVVLCILQKHTKGVQTPISSRKTHTIGLGSKFEGPGSQIETFVSLNSDHWKKIGKS